MRPVKFVTDRVKKARQEARKNILAVCSSFIIIVILLGVCIFYLLRYGDTWLRESSLAAWELYGAGALIIISICVLSLLPAIIFFAFYIIRKESIVKEAQMELEHYEMAKGTLPSEIEDRFEEAQKPQRYGVPILLSNLAVSVGWFLFFFVKGPNIVFDLAEHGDISIIFSNLVVADPVVFGFLGAFCYSLQMLMRRFFSGDINPSVFMHIGIRTWIVLVITVVIGAIWTWTGRTEDEPAPAALLAISFIIGIIPSVGFDLIKKAASPLSSGFGNPFSNGSLDIIPGVNIWRQARLAEENIDSIPSLATCDVVSLIANTRLGVRKIIHWVDQAILIVHIGEDNFDKFLQAGICSATALEAAYAGQLSEDEINSFKNSCQDKPVTYLGCKGVTYVPKTPDDLARSIEPDKDWGPRLRNLVIAICDDVNYQRLWGILHGTSNAIESNK